MNKIFLLCTVIVAVAFAAPDSMSNLPDSVAATVDAVTPTSTFISTGKPVITTNEHGTVEDRTKLVAKLFQDYDKKVNPDDVKLKFGVSLIDFHILEDKNAMQIHAWLRHIWQDPRLKWNADEHGGATVLRMDSDMVWKPDITLHNSKDSVMMNCWNSNILIFATGEILWVPPCIMVSQCHLTLKKEPYAEQVCGLKFGSWTFDGTIIDPELYNGKKFMDLSDLNDASGFEIISNVADKYNKFYPCCPEPYPFLTFNITIKRIPGEELIKKW